MIQMGINFTDIVSGLTTRKTLLIAAGIVAAFFILPRFRR